MQLAKINKNDLAGAIEAIKWLSKHCFHSEDSEQHTYVGGINTDKIVNLKIVRFEIDKELDMGVILSRHVIGLHEFSYINYKPPENHLTPSHFSFIFYLITSYFKNPHFLDRRDYHPDQLRYEIDINRLYFNVKNDTLVLGRFFDFKFEPLVQFVGI